MTDYVEENMTATYADSRFFKSVPPGGSPIPEGEWPVIEELPAWQALLGQIKSLTEDQALELSAAWGTPWGVGQFDTWDSIRRDAWIAAWSAARSAAWSADLGTDWSAAQSAVRTAVLDADWDTDWSAGHPTVLDAAMDAVRGLMLLDLEPDVAEILLAPWVSVMGRSWEVPA